MHDPKFIRSYSILTIGFAFLIVPPRLEIDGRAIIRVALQGIANWKCHIFLCSW